MAKLKIGVLVGLTDQPEKDLQKVHDFGLQSCQVSCWKPELYTPDVGRALKKASDELDVEITTLWAGYPGPSVWDFIEGPKTLGLVPPEYRAIRLEALKKGADFAAELGLPSITTHCGFIPETPSDPLWPGLIDAVREIADHCLKRKLEFWFETGQETPVTLLRTIETVGTGNLGVNLDPANLILYGKANPVDALDVFGHYVRDVHAKDGLYPTDGNNLGQETPLGQGKVNFPVFIPKLKSLGYEGALTIEREISGPQQEADIRLAIEFLKPLC